jgi:hypothetical protein
MSAHHRRLRRLEVQHIIDLATAAGAPYGFSAWQVIDEARRFFALPQAEQDAKLEALYAELTPEEARELDAVRARHSAIVRQMPKP